MSSQLLFTIASFHLLALYFPVTMVALWLRPKWWLPMLSIFLGYVTGWIALRTEEPQVPILLLLVFAFFAGNIVEKRGWVVAVLLAVWTPLLGVAARMAGVIPGPGSAIPGEVVAFVPAFAGVYLGSLVRRASRGRIPAAEVQRIS